MGNPILGQGFGEPQPRIGPLAGQINHPSCCPGDNKNLPILRLFQGMEGLHPSPGTQPIGLSSQSWRDERPICCSFPPSNHTDLPCLKTHSAAPAVVVPPARTMSVPL